MSQYQHFSDYVRVLYKRRWAAVAVFFLVFVSGATTSLRKASVYEAGAQLLIEKIEKDDDFYQTQVRMLQSRSLAWRVMTALAMDRPPSESERRALVEASNRRVQGGWLGRLAALLGAPKPMQPPAEDETSWQSARIDRYLAGLAVVPIPDSRLVNIRYRAQDPAFASRAANALADAYIAHGLTGEYGGTHVQVVDRAEMPRIPVLPNHQRDLLFSMMTGLLVAIGLALGVEYLDGRIRTPDDIKAYLGLPFLGLVPVVRAKEQKGASLLLEHGVPPAFSEAMRAVRTSVMFSSAGDGPRSVMVTSTAPDEGKTVLSTNLADALAQAEQRTLVIDGDMRRPRVHEVFQCAQEPGLSNAVVGNVPVQSVIRKTGNPFLDVLPAGHIPPNPAELLGSPRYKRLMEELGRSYDWIIIDAPPVMAVTDAAIISNGVSGVVFVVGAEMTPRRTARNALDQLRTAQAKVIGAVLNRVDVHKHSYYYAPYYRRDYTRAYARTP